MFDPFMKVSSDEKGYVAFPRNDNRMLFSLFYRSMLESATYSQKPISVNEGVQSSQSTVFLDFLSFRKTSKLNTVALLLDTL